MYLWMNARNVGCEEIMRKGSKALNTYLFNWYKGNKYHVAHTNRRFYLCDCGAEFALNNNLGFRRLNHTHVRNDPINF